jgi:hypothetical protein
MYISDPLIRFTQSYAWMSLQSNRYLKQENQSLPLPDGLPNMIMNTNAAVWPISFLLASHWGGEAHDNERRTALDWAGFIEEIAAQHEQAEKITLAKDNLNTHKAGSFYEKFPPEKAKALWDRFEFVHTPKHGSWLNIAEIELNVLWGQCLNRRIDDIETVRKEAVAWQDTRNNKNTKVNWQFATADARVKLSRLYPTLNS